VSDDGIDGEKRLAATEEMVERALGWQSSNVAALAQAIANKQHVEQWIKVVEAQEKSRHTTEAAHVQEREARASVPYKAALEAFRDAVREEQRLRYTWQLTETLIEVWRTKCANDRRTM
jgi:type II secretory pathway component HofQ